MRPPATSLIALALGLAALPLPARGERAANVGDSWTQALRFTEVPSSVLTRSSLAEAVNAILRHVRSRHPRLPEFAVRWEPADLGRAHLGELPFDRFQSAERGIGHLARLAGLDPVWSYRGITLSKDISRQAWNRALAEVEFPQLEVNGTPLERAVEDLLVAVKRERPDLPPIRLHWSPPEAASRSTRCEVHAPLPARDCLDLLARGARCEILSGEPFLTISAKPFDIGRVRALERERTAAREAAELRERRRRAQRQQLVRAAAEKPGAATAMTVDFARRIIGEAEAFYVEARPAETAVASLPDEFPALWLLARRSDGPGILRDLLPKATTAGRLYIVAALERLSIFDPTQAARMAGEKEERVAIYTYIGLDVAPVGEAYRDYVRNGKLMTTIAGKIFLAEKELASQEILRAALGNPAAVERKAVKAAEKILMQAGVFYHENILKPGSAPHQIPAPFAAAWLLARQEDGDRRLRNILALATAEGKLYILAALNYRNHSLREFSGAAQSNTQRVNLRFRPDGAADGDEEGEPVTEQRPLGTVLAQHVLSGRWFKHLEAVFYRMEYTDN